MTSTVQKLQKVQAEIAKLIDLNYSYKTDGEIVGLGYIQRMSERELVRALASIIVRKGPFKEACKILGIELDFLIDGNNEEDLIEDIKLAHKILTIEDKLTKLRKIESQLEELFDKEDKMSILDNQLNDLLN